MKGKIYITALLLACCAAAAGAVTPLTVITSATYTTAGADDKAYALTTDADGNVFLTGNSGTNYLSQKYSKTLVVSPSAQQLYTPAFTGGKAKGITLDGQGNIIVTGEEMNSSGNLDFLALKYSANFSGLLSSAVYNGGGFDSGAAVKTDSQNNIFLAGYTEVASNQDLYIIKYSPVLNKLSTAAYDGGGTDQFAALTIDRNDNVIAAGFTFGTSYNFLVYKYDNNLHKLYGATFGGAGDDRATGVAVDNSNNIIVTGRLHNGVNQDYCTLKYDGFLNLVSSAIYNGGGTDIPTGVGVDSNDNIIVTGQSDNNYFTIKYDRNFNVLSSSTYDGGATDLSNAMAVDADDNVVVTGQSYYGSNFNYFTVKYNASAKISAASPLYIGKTPTVTLTGKGFLADTVISFPDTGISTTTAVTYVSGQSLTQQVAVSTAVVLGVTTVTVTNANGDSANYYLASTWLSTTVAANQPATLDAMTKLGAIVINIPSGSFPYQEDIISSMVPVAAGDLRQVGEALYFSVANSSPPVVNISIKLRYSVADLGGYPEASLLMAYYDATAGWVNVTSSVNTGEKSVTGLSKAYNTKFAVVKEAAGAGGGGTGGGTGGGAGGSGIPAKVYPNPYRPGSGGNFDQSTLGDGIVFGELGANRAFKLTLLDVAGRLVYQKAAVADSAGKYLWDTKTDSGGKAASGVYIYLITGGGETRKGKFSIIR